MLAILLLLLFVPKVYADDWVNGYYRKNGTYVQGHYRSSSNDTASDNWSTKGNINPYTGKAGTKNSSYDYLSPQATSKIKSRYGAID